MLDLRKPHGADMAQGVGIGQGEAQHHHVRPGENGTGTRDNASSQGRDRTAGACPPYEPELRNCRLSGPSETALEIKYEMVEKQK